MNPVSRAAPPRQTPLFVLDEYFEEVAAEHADTLQVVPEEQRAEVAGTCSLQAFYDAWMADWRANVVDDGGAKGTQDKERQALRRYTLWDLEQAPPSFPASLIWPGLPVGRITTAYLQKFVNTLPERTGIRPATVQSTWFALRTVLNYAVKLKVLESAPKAPKLDDPRNAADLDAEFCKTSYSLQELGRLYRELSGTPDLQAALVISVNCGPRTVDLFGLKWETNVRLDQDQPEIRYRAQKTGKKHWMPLASVSVAHFERMRKARLFQPEGLVFPRLTSAKCKDPERSKAARRRNAAIKDVMLRAEVPMHKSIDYNKPWQVGRTTCNTRLESRRPGIGMFLLHGPDADVNSKSYYNYTGDARDAVLSVEQPPEFLEILN